MRRRNILESERKVGQLVNRPAVAVSPNSGGRNRRAGWQPALLAQHALSATLVILLYRAVVRFNVVGKLMAAGAIGPGDEVHVRCCGGRERCF
jgi:hypothetical protein